MRTSVCTATWLRAFACCFRPESCWSRALEAFFIFKVPELSDGWELPSELRLHLTWVGDSEQFLGSVVSTYLYFLLSVLVEEAFDSAPYHFEGKPRIKDEGLLHAAPEHAGEKLYGVLE